MCGVEARELKNCDEYLYPDIHYISTFYWLYLNLSKEVKKLIVYTYTRLCINILAEINIPLIIKIFYILLLTALIPKIT